MVTLYTTHCPKCIVLEKKMNMKGIQFEVVDNMDELARLGIQSVPMLSVDGGERMDFTAASKWVNGYQGGTNG